MKRTLFCPLQMGGVGFLPLPGIDWKTCCFGFCLAVSCCSAVNTQQPTWTLSALKYLDQPRNVYNGSAPLHLHKQTAQDSTVSTPHSPALPSYSSINHHYPEGPWSHGKTVFPRQWLSSHTNPSALVVLKRDWWGCPPSLTDLNESSLSESTGRRGGWVMKRRGGRRQSNRYNGTYITLHPTVSHSEAGTLVAGLHPHWRCCVCSLLLQCCRLDWSVFVSRHGTS